MACKQKGRRYKFGKNILQYRIKKDLSQTEFGDLVGVTRRQVWAWEKGLEYPRDTNMEKINLLIND